MSDDIKNAADLEGQQADTQQHDATAESAGSGGNSGDGQGGSDAGPYEVVFGDDEAASQKAHNAQQAARRIQRRREKALREAREAIDRGELPDDLRVNPTLPAKPNPEDYFGDAGLERFQYDQGRAQAQYSADLLEWNDKAIEARSNANSAQTQRVQDYRQRSTKAAEIMKGIYDQAEQYNWHDFEEKESELSRVLGDGIDIQIGELFPDNAAAIIYHLGSNPHKLDEIKAMGGTAAVVALTRLSDKLKIVPAGRQRSNAAEPDTGLPRGENLKSVAGVKAAMDVAANKGDHQRYITLEKQYRAMGGK